MGFFIEVKGAIEVKGVIEVKGADRPKIDEFKKSTNHEKKTLEAVEQLHRKNDKAAEEKYFTKFPCKKFFFKESVFQLSNSGALDYYGINVKEVKTVMRFSKAAASIIYELRV